MNEEMIERHKRIENNYRLIIEEIIKFRKTAWNITEEDAEKIRQESYFLNEVKTDE